MVRLDLFNSLPSRKTPFPARTPFDPKCKPVRYWFRGCGLCVGRAGRQDGIHRCRRGADDLHHTPTFDGVRDRYDGRVLGGVLTLPGM